VTIQRYLDYDFYYVITMKPYRTYTSSIYVKIPGKRRRLRRFLFLSKFLKLRRLKSRVGLNFDHITIKSLNDSGIIMNRIMIIYTNVIYDYIKVVITIILIYLIH
jgi:hypothetical protein